MRFGGIFDYDAKSDRLKEVTIELEDPKIWDDPEKAQSLGKERSILEDVVNGCDDLDARLIDTKDLLELAVSENDESTVNEIVADLELIEKEVADM